jgi:hypothetical protein
MNIPTVLLMIPNSPKVLLPKSRAATMALINVKTLAATAPRADHNVPDASRRTNDDASARFHSGRHFLGIIENAMPFTPLYVIIKKA